MVSGLVVGGVMPKSHVAFTMGWARWVVHLPSASHHGFHCLDLPSLLSKSSCLALGRSHTTHQVSTLVSTGPHLVTVDRKLTDGTGKRLPVRNTRGM